MTSRHGTTVLPARVTPEVKRGELFATFAFPGAHVNRLTGPGVDAVTGTPEYKVTAVRIEKNAEGFGGAQPPSTRGLAQGLALSLPKG